MGLDVPATRREFLRWTMEYESRYAYTDGARAVVDQLFVDWQNRWFPGPMKRIAAGVLLAVFTDDLREVHRLPVPSAAHCRVVPPAIGAYLQVQGMRPHRPHRSWSDHFGTRHPMPLDVPTLGHRPAVVRRIEVTDQHSSLFRRQVGERDSAGERGLDPSARDCVSFERDTRRSCPKATPYSHLQRGCVEHWTARRCGTAGSRYRHMP